MAANLMSESDFLFSLNVFMKKRGTPITKEPILGGKRLDLYQLYNEVISYGGLMDVIKKKAWMKIFRKLDNFSENRTDASTALKTIYIKYLFPYEHKYFQLKDDVVDEEELQKKLKLVNYGKKQHKQLSNGGSKMLSMRHLRIDSMNVTYAATSLSELKKKRKLYYEEEIETFPIEPKKARLNETGAVCSPILLQELVHPLDSELSWVSQPWFWDAQLVSQRLAGQPLFVQEMVSIIINISPSEMVNVLNLWTAFEAQIAASSYSWEEFKLLASLLGFVFDTEENWIILNSQMTEEEHEVFKTIVTYVYFDATPTTNSDEILLASQAILSLAFAQSA